MAEKLNYGINFDLIKRVDSDTESPVKSGHLTLRSHDCNAGENLTVLDRIDSIKVKAEQLLAAYDPNKVNVISNNLFKTNYKKIETIEELQTALSDVLIRFDTNPENYKKDDYFALLKVLKGATLFLYEYVKESKTKFDEIDILVINILDLIDLLITEKFSITIVDNLPTNPKENIIYVLHTEEAGHDIYSLYLYYGNKWIPISSSQSGDLKVYPYREDDFVSIGRGGSLKDSGYGFIDVGVSDFSPLEEILADKAVASYNGVDIDGKFTQIDSKNNSQDSAIASLLTSVDNISEDLQNEVDNINSELDLMQDLIDTLKDTTEQQSENITNLSNTVSNHTTAISNINASINNISDDISDVSSNVSSLADGLDDVTQELNNFETSTTEALNNIEDDILDLANKVSDIEENNVIEYFEVRYNPKFDLFHRPTNNDRAPLLLNRCSIETINGKRFFNIDIVYNNFIPASATSQGFEQGEILFLFPRMAGTNYIDYTSLLDSQYTPLHTPAELYQLNQYYVAGWISRINEINTTTGTSVAICCQISNVGEVINNTNAFFKSATATLDKVYHITGRYEIASDWTLLEYNNYNFQ